MISIGVVSHVHFEIIKYIYFIICFLRGWGEGKKKTEYHRSNYPEFCSTCALFWFNTLFILKLVKDSNSVYYLSNKLIYHTVSTIQIIKYYNNINNMVSNRLCNLIELNVTLICYIASVITYSNDNHSHYK